MGFETYKSKPLTEEEKEKTKSRMISDANLVRGGAELRDDGSLEVTKSQIKNAKREMDAEKGHYFESSTINGTDVIIGWYNDHQDYELYFPQIDISDEARDKGVPDQVIPISENRETAKKVFDFASQAAQNEKDVYKLFKKVRDFVRNLPEEDDEE